MIRARDLFAGAGGWDVAAQSLGWSVDGIEINAAARATRDAAGLSTTGDDVRKVEAVPGEYDVDIASPPCQSFSMAGGGSGRRALDVVLAGVNAYRAGNPPTHDELTAATGDERTALVLEPLRIALAGRSPFLAWEQVPAVLPVWQACAEVLREVGYSVAVGVLNAEQFGVPQTRRRAVLLARWAGRRALLPIATHSRYHVRTPDRLDAGVPPWVSMAEALGWGMTSRPYFTIASGRTSGGPDMEKIGGARARAALYAERDAGRWVLRNNNQPNSSIRRLDQPAGTIAFGHTAETCRFERDNGAERCRITIAEAATLQSFPDGFPFRGSATAQFSQVGNAIPPVLAAAILAALGVPS